MDNSGGDHLDTWCEVREWMYKTTGTKYEATRQEVQDESHHMRSLKYLGVLFGSEGGVDGETDRLR